MSPRRFLAPIVLALALSFGSSSATTAATTGCTPAAWATFVTVASEFVSYVQTFITGAKAVWPQIDGLLGGDAPAADKQFQKAIVDVTSALAALQDGIKVATIAQQPNPDLGAAIAAVQDAVSAVMVIVNQYRAQAAQAGVGAARDALTAQAKQIADWPRK